MSRRGRIQALVVAVIASTSVAVHGGETASADHSAHGGSMQSQRAQTEMPDSDTSSADPHAGHGAVPATEPSMDHGQMQMQGESAPPDTRDPHAYSNGLKRGEGDYAVPGVPKLMLADEHRFASLLAEKLERRFADKGDDSTTYDLQGWYGTTYDRAVFKAEGDRANGKLDESRTELLWGHAISTFWDTQMGVRADTGEGPDRQWLALGVQGLAPYWFNVDATAYLGTGGKTAFRLEASYELLFTQRLILEPNAELKFYGKDDPESRIGRGLAAASAGLRLRYEFTRQFAPYIGIERTASYGKTADYLEAENERARQTQFVAGLRFWF